MADDNRRRVTQPFGVITDRGRHVHPQILAGFEISTKAGGDAGTRPSRQITEDQPVKGIHGLVEPPYPVESLVKLPGMNTYHYRAVRTKSREGAGLGWEFVPKDAKVKSEDITPEQEKERKALEDRANAFDEPLNHTYERVLMDFESLGYAALEVLPNDLTNEVGNIKHINTRYLLRHRDRERFCEIRGVERTWFKDIASEGEVDYRSGEWLDREDPFALRGEETSEERGTLPETEGISRPRSANLIENADFDDDRRGNPLIWWDNYVTESDYYGMPDVIPAVRAIMGDLSRSEYNISFFDNYGIPAYAVFVTGNFDPGDPVDDNGDPLPIEQGGKTPLQRAVEDNFAQLADKPYSTISFFIPSTDTEEGGVEIRIEKLGHDVSDAAFRMYRMDNRDETLSAHGVPAERAGVHIEGSLGGNIARENTEIYKDAILEQRQEMIEHQMNKYVFVSDFWKWQFKRLDTKDTDAEHSRDLAEVAAGIMSPNEFRVKWGKEKVEDPAMDLHYINGLPIDAEEGEIPAALAQRAAPPSLNGAPVGNGVRRVPIAPTDPTRQPVRTR